MGNSNSYNQFSSPQIIKTINHPKKHHPNLYIYDTGYLRIHFTPDVYCYGFKYEELESEIREKMNHSDFAEICEEDLITMKKLYDEYIKSKSL
jgi:hypothetical protein